MCIGNGASWNVRSNDGGNQYKVCFRSPPPEGGCIRSITDCISGDHSLGPSSPPRYIADDAARVREIMPPLATVPGHTHTPRSTINTPQTSSHIPSPGFVS
ncbi:hypothetical protein CISG_04883 [Coccidioides immitis RMSCC 3703]|uniref:Uncharacterized protein n=1 Tax=Coccidioides immitis RMSCC 3703 TaxID=454286 RepID=A0A0J8QSG4_COCIT|nr:hypothetical protein CISG_04883 [Coccidioides immitis RMSCC 3703]